MFSLLPQSISAFDLSFYSFSKTEALLFFSGNSMNWAILCRLFLGVGLCTALLSYVSSLLHPICLSLHLQSGTGRSYQLLPSVLPPLIVSSLWPDLDKKGMCTPPPRPAPPPLCESSPLAATDFFKPDLMTSCQFSFFFVFVQHLTVLTTLFSYYFGPFWVLEYYFPVSPPLPIK